MRRSLRYDSDGVLQESCSMRTMSIVTEFAIAGAAVMAFAQASAQESATHQGVRAALNTEFGEVIVEVFPAAAPLSACDFLAYVDNGLYRGASFYRVVREDNDRGSPKIAVVQGGLQDESRERAPIAHETTEQTGLKHVDGALSLARGAVGTGGGAAFFVVIGNQPGLDFGGARNSDRQGFAVFGRVVRGMDIVRRIHQMKEAAPTDDPYLQGQVLAKPVTIKQARRLDPLPKVCTSKK
jgi:peptidyl-prolyl cis-trans isomerase A (cyclophilin A)